MRAIIEFELPEDRAEHQLALDAWRWQAVVDDMFSHLRGIIKHGNDDQAAKYAEYFRDKMVELLENYDLHNG